jgi:hypothetical protein
MKTESNEGGRNISTNESASSNAGSTNQGRMEGSRII